MLGSLVDVLLVSALATQTLAAPARNAAPRAAPAPATRDRRSNMKRQQDAAPSPAIINPAAGNVWNGIQTRGPIVLDLPTGVAASGPPSASGQAYPTETLIGYNGQPVSGDSSVPSPSLIPAQSANAKDGLILDFESVQDPQPIRGSTGKSGGSDPESVGK